MRRVLKYVFPLQNEETTHRMPLLAQLVKVSHQHGQVTAWFLVRENDQFVNRKFMLYGTGHPIIDERAVFLGTSFCPSGLVWHLFQVDGERLAENV